MKQPQYTGLEIKRMQIAIVQSKENSLGRQKLVENQCCDSVHFEMHNPLQDDWVQCACTRLLHKDCQLQLCPY